MNGELHALGSDEYVDYLRGFHESTVARPIPPEFLELALSESAKVSRPTRAARRHLRGRLHE
jgi:hypothetical protein